MNKINVIVPDMQSNHCTSRVSLILNKIDGIQTEEIKSGEVTFSFEDDYAKEEALTAISKAGYTIAQAQVETTQNNNMLEFKTNINCGGCVAKVSGDLNGESGICHWEVDTQSPDKILKVELSGIEAQKVIDLVQKNGFKISPIK